jgi:hypothetical protein
MVQIAKKQREGHNVCMSTIPSRMKGYLAKNYRARQVKRGGNGGPGKDTAWTCAKVLRN